MEIGSGWGALAFEASDRQCSVKTITLSKAQHDYVVSKLKDLFVSEAHLLRILFVDSSNKDTEVMDEEESHRF